MLKVAITHDVDRVKKTYQYFTHLWNSLKKGNFKSAVNHVLSIFQKEPYWTFPQIITIEQEFGIKSTFFFLNETLKFELFKKNTWSLALGRYKINNYKIKNIIRWLDENGWEIGVHGSFNSYNNFELLKKEKTIIEEIVDHKIIGIRQHHLNLDHNTWKLQNTAGFKYDSSFGYNEKIGFKEDKYNVFFPLNNHFMIIPMAIMDNPFVHNKNSWITLNHLMDLCEKKDALLVLNWHSDNFNEKEFPGYISSFRSILDECTKRKAKFYKLSDYYNEFINDNPINNLCAESVE